MNCGWSGGPAEVDGGDHVGSTAFTRSNWLVACVQIGQPVRSSGWWFGAPTARRKARRPSGAQIVQRRSRSSLVAIEEVARLQLDLVDREQVVAVLPGRRGGARAVTSASARRAVQPGIAASSAPFRDIRRRSLPPNQIPGEIDRPKSVPHRDPVARAMSLTPVHFCRRVGTHTHCSGLPAGRTRRPGPAASSRAASAASTVWVYRRVPTASRRPSPLSSTWDGSRTQLHSQRLEHLDVHLLKRRTKNETKTRCA